MITKFTSFVVSIATAITMIFSLFIVGTAPEDKTDFTPVLRFIACSDSHISSMGDKSCSRIEKVLKIGYAIADADEEYNSLDAFLIAGDITNQGTKNAFVGFKAVTDKFVRDETKIIPILAKSHDGNKQGKQGLKYFSELMGCDNDISCVINGYHFIGISASKIEGDHYSEYQREWLRAELDKAKADDPLKPIFVMQHEHIQNTVYGSSDIDGWGMDYFSDILKDYPQVVDFSGHSHYPINDPRSVWQGDFTAIGTGALAYLEFTVDTTRKIHPTGYQGEAQFWMVEVDAENSIRLRGIDLEENKVLCEYILKNPSVKSEFEFTPEKQAAKSTAPVFSEGASIKCTRTFSNATVKIPAAQSTDSMPIFLYRAYVYDENGNEVDMQWKLPKYYSATVEKSEKISLKNIKKGYTVKVVAETAYGVQSEPLTVVVK